MMPIEPFIPRRSKQLDEVLSQGAMLLDVRNADEYAGFHFSGALNIPYDELDRYLGMMKQWERPVVVYSTHGNRSKTAATKLRNHGINVFDAGSRENLSVALRQAEQRR